jgi:hypothetical protein
MACAKCSSTWKGTESPKLPETLTAPPVEGICAQKVQHHPSCSIILIESHILCAVRESAVKTNGSESRGTRPLTRWLTA